MPPLHSVGIMPVEMAWFIAFRSERSSVSSASIHSSGGNLSSPAALHRRRAAMWCFNSVMVTIPFRVS